MGYFEVPYLSVYDIKFALLPNYFYSTRHKAYKHVFTSPSSVDREPKATRSGNARIHGMTRVTPPSIAYIATQVCLCFGSVCSY